MPPKQRKEQYAALPFRRANGGALEIMLVTTRGSGRWIVPKGWPVPGLEPPQSAAHEALEEGGLVGQINEQAIGRYDYVKKLADGTCLACAVTVFALEVSSQLPSWPEQLQRKTRWFTVEDAASAVHEPALCELIRSLRNFLVAHRQGEDRTKALPMSPE